MRVDVSKGCALLKDGDCPLCECRIGVHIRTDFVLQALAQSASWAQEVTTEWQRRAAGSG